MYLDNMKYQPPDEGDDLLSIVCVGLVTFGFVIVLYLAATCV